MRLARRLVRCYFWTPSSPSAHLLHPQAGGWTGGPCLVIPSTNTNTTTTQPTTYLMGHPETNARLEGGGGGSRS